MNLVTDRWLPVTRQDGSQCKIAPWQIAETDNPVVEVNAPRTDFQGALYQFLIGLLQTTFAPEDDEQWFEFWEELPSEPSLQQAFISVQSAFELVSDGPAFLQDFDLPEAERKSMSALLIEAPGGKTLKDNLDHFIKSDTVTGVCESCTATALFALQTNAPSGGVGHRVGLRGGGPLTTLVLPEAPTASLWHKLWLNVLTREDYEPESQNLADIFPWLGKTRLSDKSGQSTQPGDTHPLQMYWGMPRRIRLINNKTTGNCSLCGAQDEALFNAFMTKNYGVNYEGPWLHPLTPYRKDPKNKKPPLSLKGQQGGLGYRHWLGLCLTDAVNGDGAAEVVQRWQERVNYFPEIAEAGMRLWCFGFDMDNMKARCWYEHQMPLIKVDANYRETFIDLVSQLLTAAKDTVYVLRTQIKAAWFSRPKDAKGDISMIDQTFWQKTESAFYQHLNTLAILPENTSVLPAKLAKQWVEFLRKTATDQFDFWVLEGDIEDRDMKRIIDSRRLLSSKLKTLKSLKPLWQLASTCEEEQTKPEVA